MTLGARLAAVLLVAGVAAGCAATDSDPGDAAPSREPDRSSSGTTEETPSDDVVEAPAPTYLGAGDLPDELSLQDVGARTRQALPFADFAAAGGGGVWLSGVAPGVARYDSDGRITARARIPGDVVQALTATAEEVWVPSSNPNALFRIQATTGDELARVRLPAEPLPEAVVGAAGRRAYVLIDLAEPRIAVVEGDVVVDEVPAPEGAVAVRAGYGSLWVPTSDDTVHRIDLDTGESTVIPVGPDPRFLDVGFGAAWVMNQGDGSVSRIDSDSGESKQLAVTGVPIGGGDLTVGAGAVWLRTDSQVVRIDPQTRRATHVISPPPGSASAAATDEFLLISNHDHDAVHVVPLPLPQ